MIAASVCASLLSQAAHAAPCRLADLHWMTGVWRSGDSTTKSEERWTAGPGDRLMGSFWELRTDAPGGSVEASTIQPRGDGLALVLRHFSATLGQAREEKDAPMVFMVARCDASTVVFDGQGAQTGEHMTYHRLGGRLEFTGEFIHQGQPLRVELSFTRTGD
jgi:hypothetical protein